MHPNGTLLHPCSFTYTLNELIPDDPTIVSKMLTSLTEDIESGVVRSLPAKIYEFQSGLVDAFRRLKSGLTIGKVVIRLQGMQDDIGIAVIAGGLGGLGLVTAETLLSTWAQIMWCWYREADGRRTTKARTYKTD